MKAWLKGGIVGFIIFLIYVIIGFPFSLFILVSLRLCSYESSPAIFNCDMGINLGTLFLLLIPLGLVVIISSIIGWIMGKIFDSNLKAWLKGGLIVTTYGIFVYIIDILLGIGLIFNFPASRLSNYVPHFGIPSGWIIAYLLINFIIGAIIGWIYGKIKAKKQQPIQIK